MQFPGQGGWQTITVMVMVVVSEEVLLPMQLGRSQSELLTEHHICWILATNIVVQ